MAKCIELNHIIEDWMMTSPGFPRPRIGALLDHQASRFRYEGKAEFYLGKVEMVCNLGTYLDAPFHRHPKGRDLSQIPLEDLAGVPAIVADPVWLSHRSVTVKGSESDWDGRAVLVRTGWDERWNTERYWEPGPYLSEELVDRLIRSKVKLVGVDFANVDDITDLSRPAHTRLLAENILIVESLCNLSSLPGEGSRFFAVPLRIARGASFPVRAFAEVAE